MSVTANGTVTLSALTPYSGNGTNPFNPANNRLVGSTYNYDARGDVTGIGAVTAAYDAEANQTSTADTGTGQTISYKFDAEGQRVEKQISGGATIIDVHDAFGQLAAEYNSAGVTPACTTCYLAYDGVGSVRLVTNQSGGIVARHDYLPFGEEIPNGTAGRNGNFGYTTNLTQGFTGQESDGGTASLDYFNARHVAAVLGAFTQPDPMSAGADFVNPQSWNAYGYVLGNPLALVDPSGMAQQATVSGWEGGCYSAEYAYPCYGIPGGGTSIGWGGGWDDNPVPSGGGSPPPIGGVGTGSASAGGGMAGSLPPGPFPGGESLGLPPGVSVPAPWSSAGSDWCGFIACSQFDQAAGSVITQPASKSLADIALREALTAAFFRLFSISVGIIATPVKMGDATLTGPNYHPAPAWNRQWWSCTASCNLQGIKANEVPFERVFGTGSGPNESLACLSAKRAATQSAPAGTYARHCQCTCSSR